MSRVRVKSQELESKVKGHGSMIKRPEVKGQRLGVRGQGYRVKVIIRVVRVVEDYGQRSGVKGQESKVMDHRSNGSLVKVQGSGSKVNG